MLARFFRHLAVVSACAIVLAPIVASADMANDEEAQKLKERNSPRYNLAMPGASMRAGGAMVLVNAPMAVVRKVVLDFAHYQTFMPRFQKSRVVAKKDGKTDVYLQVPILHGAATVWALTRFDPPAKEGANGEVISGKMVEGNVDDFRAIWHLRPVDDTHTILKSEILIVPKLPLPGSVVTPELEFAADQAVVSARDRAEAKAAAGNAEANATEPAKLRHRPRCRLRGRADRLRMPGGSACSGAHRRDARVRRRLRVSCSPRRHRGAGHLARPAS